MFVRYFKDMSLEKAKEILFYCYCTLLLMLPMSKALVEILSVVIVVLGFIVFLVDLKAKGRLPFFEDSEGRRLLFLLALYCISVAVTLLWTSDFSLSLKAFFVKVLKGILLFAFLPFCRESLQKKNGLLFWVITTSAILLSLDAGWQVISGSDFLRGRVMHKSEVTASFHNPNLLAAWCLITFSMLGYNFFSSTKRFHKSVSVCSFVVLLPFFAMTNCRAAWIAFFIVSVIFVFALRDKYKWLYVLLVFICGVIAYIVMQKYFANLLGLESTRHRLALWKKAVYLASEVDFIGSGLNTYALFTRTHIFDWMPEVAQFHYPHNSYLQMFVEVGIAGVLSFFAFIGYFIRLILKNLSKKNDLSLLCLFLGLVAFLLHALFDNHLYSLQLSVLFWIFLGILYCRTLQKS